MEGSTRAEDDNWTVKTLFTIFHKTLEAMLSVMVAFKSALTFSTETKMSFRMCMRHPRKAHLIQLSFEKELTKKCREQWKDRLLMGFNPTGKRRLQLY